ncbi:hypothetical protein GGR15_002733 [Butyricimonas paravirosa]|uniref:Uncharacterized protein n=1 Tax=Butyricimonas paravirosa TaxID=1472417 RepID=A0A7X5YEU5_9BACT|nr:hypothetical protein [Butyricimonas paravirosa]
MSGLFCQSLQVVFIMSSNYYYILIIMLIFAM